MKPLQIDFAPQHVRSASRLLWLVLVVAVAGAAGGGILGTSLSERADARARQAAQLLEQQTSLNEAVQQQEQVPQEVADAVNSAVRMLDYPTMDLLAQLERHIRPEVTLVSVELGPVRNNLRVVVQATSALPVLDYMDAIKTEPGFRTVALTRQEAVSSGDPQAGWRFTLEVPQAEASLQAGARPKGGER